jgi:hypothetical protein
MAIKQILTEIGNGYKIQTIDLERCLYKNINGKYDIEVSGLNDLRRKFITVYVWKRQEGIDPSVYHHTMKIVYTSKRLRNIAELKTELKEIEEHFKGV